MRDLVGSRLFDLWFCLACYACPAIAAPFLDERDEVLVQLVAVMGGPRIEPPGDRFRKLQDT